MSEIKSTLSKLSKEEKIALLQALDAKQQKQKDKRAGLTLHQGQLRVRKSLALTKIVTPGNGWGKSTFAVDFIRDRALGNDRVLNKFTKVPLRIIVVLDHPTKVNDVYRTEYNKWYEYAKEITEDKMGTPHVKQWNYKNGSFVRFMTWDQDANVFESIECDLLVFDEPPPRKIFVALSRGQRSKNVQPETVVVGTPVTTEAAWLREDFIQPWIEGKRKDVECFTGGTHENENNLGAGYIERYSAHLSDKEKRIRLYGEFASVEGLAFGHQINDTIHALSTTQMHWEYSWPVVVGIDPHPSKAHVAVMVGRRPGDDKLFVLKEISAKLTAREFAAELLRWAAGYRVTEWTCDSLGSAESTGHEGFKSFIDVLRECGLSARPTTFDDKLHEDAVERIRGMLALEDSGPPLFEKSARLRFIIEGAPRAYKELKNISWVYDKKRELNKPKLDSAKLDFYSALTYALASSYLAKTLGSYGTASPRRTSVTGAGRAAAQGLGITTSKARPNSYKWNRNHRATAGDDD